MKSTKQEIRLKAAAPYLAEALQKIYKIHVDGGCNGSKYGCQVCEYAEKALAKLPVEYKVIHYRQNPRLNETKIFSRKSDAIKEMQLYISDTAPCGCCHLLADSKIIATRSYNKSRIKWLCKD